jgi:FkbM family methyltransferase
MRSVILDLLPPIFVRALRRLRAKIRAAAATNQLGIELGPAQKIAEYRGQFRLYDRFLPVLGRHLPKGWIVDVGANVGDTAAVISKECDNPIVCVEASDEFYPLLVRNTAGLPVRCIYAMAGTGRYGGKLVSLGSTARLSRSETESPAVPLDDLLSTSGVPSNEVVLIKTDTDGYDADAILSAEGVIRSSEPLLFWENYFLDCVEERDLDTLYRTINAWGYQHIWVFDNFGNLMLAECGYAALRDLNRYIISQERHACTRTVFYTDVLATTDRHLERARKGIADYRANMIELAE